MLAVQIHCQSNITVWASFEFEFYIISFKYQLVLVFKEIQILWNCCFYNYFYPQVTFCVCITNAQDEKTDKIHRMIKSVMVCNHRIEVFKCSD